MWYSQKTKNKKIKWTDVLDEMFKARSGSTGQELPYYTEETWEIGTELPLFSDLPISQASFKQ